LENVVIIHCMHKMTTGQADLPCIHINLRRPVMGKS